MQTWFLTSTTYGTWLPGDERGFVSNVLNEHDAWIRHNMRNTPYDAGDRERRQLAHAAMKGSPVFLTVDHAEAIASQFHETIKIRRWNLHVFAVMASHFHTVLTTDDASESCDILRDLKSYASRRLNKSWTRPESGTWWTESGSQRPVNDDKYFVNVVRYVASQPLQLAFWIDPALEYLLVDRIGRGD